jgi:hypothetical protein
VLQAIKLRPRDFLHDLFDTTIYYRGGETQWLHACDLLSRSYAEDQSGFHRATESYSRYWWGSTSLARIFLGYGNMSIAQYRNAMFLSLLASLALFVATFARAFPHVAVCFTPYLACVCFGFSLFSLGQSISQTPEEVVGLLMLSTYNLFHIERQSLLVRSLCYGFLGSLCVYFDLLNGVAVLIATILCCQWIASAVTANKNKQNIKDRAHVYPQNGLSSLISNLLFFSGGAGFAIFVRLIGFSYVSNKSLFEVLSEWQSIFAERLGGSLMGDGGPARPPTIIDILLRLKATREYPFHAVVGKHEGDIVYALGLLAWLLLLPVCWTMLKRRKLPRDVLGGFLLAGSLIPGWYLIFKQHTVIHSWITGRLLVLFTGLGLSSLFTMFALLRGRSRAAPNPSRVIGGHESN